MKPGWRRGTSLLAAASAVAAMTGQGFRERVEVQLVRVELLATDAQGRPIRDLRVEDIHVRVDDRPVQVEGFEIPTLTKPAGLPSLPRPASEIPAPAPQQSKLTEPAAVSRPSYYMAFLSDETSSEQSNRHAAYAEMLRFLERGLPPSTDVQLMRFDGRLHVECPWTSDAERLRRGVSALDSRRVASRIGTPGALSNNPEQGSANLAFDAREAVIHVRTSLAGLFDALRTFPEKPGRKALFFVSDGAPFLTPSEIAKDLIASSTSSVDPNDPASAARAAHEAELDSDLLLDSLAWNRARSASLLTDIARLALLRGIELHPVRSAAHDLSGRVRTDRSFSNRATARSGRPLDPYSRSIRDAPVPPATDIAAGQSMEAVAETTGGEAVLSRRSFEDGLKQEFDTRDAAYVVSFRDPFAGDHRFHRIEIAVARTGLRLRYRRGYRVLDSRESLLEGAANRLFSPADANPLGVRLSLESRGLEGALAGAEIAVAYPVPPRARGIAPEGAVQIRGFCAIRNGALRSIDLSGKAEAVEFDGTTWFVRSGRIALEPGAYRWSVAIRDETTGITSYLTFDRSLP